MFHDAELKEVHLDSKNCTVCLNFLSSDNRRFDVQIDGVRSFRCGDLSMQNVVSRVLRASLVDFSADDLEYWVEWSTSLSDTDSWLKSDHKKVWLEQLQNRELEMVVFEPSAGAEIALVCTSFRLVVHR